MNIKKILLQGKEAFNDFRKLNPNLPLELTDIKLPGFDFSGYNLQGVKFLDVEFPRSTFEDADLEEAEFQWIIGEQSDFSGANLSGARMWKGIFVGADFCGANLRKVNAHKTTFARSDLTCADLTEAYFYDCYFHQADLRYSNLHRAVFKDCKLDQADFSDSRMFNTNLDAALYLAQMEGVDLDKVVVKYPTSALVGHLALWDIQRNKEDYWESEEYIRKKIFALALIADRDSFRKDNRIVAGLLKAFPDLAEWAINLEKRRW